MIASSSTPSPKPWTHGESMPTTAQLKADGEAIIV